VKVRGLEEYQTGSGKVDVAYRVEGDAGSRGKVWLAAKTGAGEWISGGAREVGPGPFAEVVDIRLTGRAAQYEAVLQVEGRRCSDGAPDPARR
jgi:hypothetical protein